MFGTYMAAFAADAPGTPADAVVNIMIGVWISGLVFVLLLIAGVVGGWIAYRKRRIGLSFGLSLLTAVPIFLIVAAISGSVRGERHLDRQPVMHRVGCAELQGAAACRS